MCLCLRRILQDIRVQQAFASRGPDAAPDSISVHPGAISHPVDPQKCLPSKLQSHSAGTALMHNASNKRKRLDSPRKQPTLTSLFGRSKK